MIKRLRYLNKALYHGNQIVQLFKPLALGDYDRDGYSGVLIAAHKKLVLERPGIARRGRKQ
jgi:hypothetical protein